MTNDLSIRSSLLHHLEKELYNSPDTRIVPEVEICLGYARIDVMLVNGILHGFEIKSDKDTLDRLVHQAGFYEQVFEKITLVCGEKHLQKSVEEVSPWWGIWVAHASATQVNLEEIRSATLNPIIDPYSLVQLLWREEVLFELEKRGLDKGVRSKPRNKLWERLVESLSIEELCSTVRACIKRRQDWRIAGQQG